MKGFTLLELMISIAILSFISLGVYQTTSSSFTLRENLERDGDFYNSIRVALDMLGRDVSHMYSPQAGALPGDVGKSPASANSTGASSEILPGLAVLWPFWAPAINAHGVRPARFVGDATKISFIANSNLRLFKDSQESDFVKVIYSLEEDTNEEKNPEKLGKALVRRTYTDFYSERENSDLEVRYTLLSRLKSLKFSFLDSEKDRWDMATHWDTGEGAYKDVYPGMIRIEVEVYTPQSKENTFAISQIFRPELSL